MQRRTSSSGLRGTVGEHEGYDRLGLDDESTLFERRLALTILAPGRLDSEGLLPLQTHLTGIQRVSTSSAGCGRSRGEPGRRGICERELEGGHRLRASHLTEGSGCCFGGRGDEEGRVENVGLGRRRREGLDWTNNLVRGHRRTMVRSRDRCRRFRGRCELFEQARLGCRRSGVDRSACTNGEAGIMSVGTTG